MAKQNLKLKIQLKHKVFSIPTTVDTELLDDREQREFSYVNYYPTHRFVHEGQKFTIKSNSDKDKRQKNLKDYVSFNVYDPKK